MYYSAVVDTPSDDYQLRDVADHYDIELKIFAPRSFQGSQILDIASNEPDFCMPVVMVGDTVLAMGDQAWELLYEHSQDNPHVHWEAGDEGDTA
jgi:hypothetical protein